jgi:hypothetical protein
MVRSGHRSKQQSGVWFNVQEGNKIKMASLLVSRPAAALRHRRRNRWVYRKRAGASLSARLSHGLRRGSTLKFDPIVALFGLERAPKCLYHDYTGSKPAWNRLRGRSRQGAKYLILKDFLMDWVIGCRANDL